MRVLFMGTPEFAEESLKALDRAGHSICGVFTQPDRARSRGLKKGKSAVKEYAERAGFMIYQPEDVKTSEAEEIVERLKPEIIVVAAYGQILTEGLMEKARYGAVNVHASLLPAYRGAAPIQRALINGERQTGVTIMHMSRRMDAGDIISSREVEIGAEETYGELYERLAIEGAELLIGTMEEISRGEAERRVQEESGASYAPAIEGEDCRIIWTKRAEEIVNQVRGLNPKPGAVGEICGERYKVYKASRTGKVSEKEAGMVVGTGRAGIEVACAGGETLMITEIQAAGKKRMSAAAFLAGHKIGG